MWSSLAQLAGTYPPVPIPVTFSPAAITAFGAMAVLVIGAMVTGVVTIIRVLAETRTVKTAIAVNAQTSERVGAQRDTTLKRIEILVDGRYGDVLQELADLKELVAGMTGKPTDILKAQAARRKADEQVARVTASGGHTDLTIVDPVA